jgi:hypothetical protein
MDLRRQAVLIGVLVATIAVIAMASVRVPHLGQAEAVPAREPATKVGALAGFDQLGTRNGRLTETAERVFDGSRAAKAIYRPNRNGFARGILDVRWLPGAEVSYGAAFFLPEGFKDAMRGGVAILRWDNYPAYGTRGDIGGLVIYNGDKKLHLIRGGYDRGYEADLIPPVDVPEGRWVHLEVRQTLSAGADAVNEVAMDGAVIARTTVPNSYGRRIQRVRYGIVSIEAGSQTMPLQLYFDGARASRSRSAR